MQINGKWTDNRRTGASSCLFVCLHCTHSCYGKLVFVVVRSHNASVKDNEDHKKPVGEARSSSGGGAAISLASSALLIFARLMDRSTVE